MARYDLTEAEWALVVEFFPEDTPRRGRPWSEHRTFISGVFWILRSGAPWRDLPERYGPWKTVYNRFRALTKDGTIDKILAKLQVKLDESGYIDWELGCVDGTNIRASKAAAGAAKKNMVTFQIHVLDEVVEDGEASSTS